MKKIIRHEGLTLIEVLIALAIISIALTAIIKASSQNIQSTSYLQEKAIALWVGKEIMNEAKTGIINAPLEPDKMTKEVIALGEKWHCQLSQARTGNQHINKLSVSISKQESDEIDPIMTLESYFNVDTEHS